MSDKPLVHYKHPNLQGFDRLNFVGPWRLRWDSALAHWFWRRDCRLSSGTMITVQGPMVHYEREENADPTA